MLVSTWEEVLTYVQNKKYWQLHTPLFVLPIDDRGLISCQVPPWAGTLDPSPDGENQVVL